MIAANDINPDNIPQSLKDLNQWHPWKIIGENQKLPVQVNGNPAKSNDPTTWTDFQSALDASQFFEGLALQITAPHVGIDLDECLEADGTLRDWALPVIARFDGKALIEYSPSGTGIKLTTIGRKPKWATCLDKTVGPGKQQLECYDNRRFWAITGKPYNRNIELSNAQVEIDWVCETYLRPKVQEAPQVSYAVPTSPVMSTQLAVRGQGYIDSVSYTGGGRNNAAFSLSGHLRSLVGDFGERLDEVTILDLMRAWNSKLGEPLSDTELQAATRSSQKNGTARVEKASQSLIVPEADDINVDYVFASDEAQDDASEYEALLLKADRQDPLTVSELKLLADNEQDETDAQTQQHIALPQKVFDNAPGFIGGYFRFLMEHSRKPLPEAFLSAAIAVLATVVGRSFRFPYEQWNTRSNLNILVLVPSGGGKDFARNFNADVLRKIDDPFFGGLLGPTNFASDTSMLTALQDHPQQLWQIDEISKVLANINSRSAGGHVSQIANVLLTLYTSSDNPAWQPKAYADTAKLITIKYPHAVIYGTSVAFDLWDNLTATQLQDGLLGRFLAFEDEPQFVEEEEVAPEVDEDGCVVINQEAIAKDPPDEIVKVLVDWLEHAKKNEVTDVRIQEAAFNRLRQHNRNIDKRCTTESPLRSALFRRLGEKTSKLSMLAAMARGSLVVTLDDVEWSILLANALTRRLATRVAGSVSENLQEAAVKKVFGIVEDAGAISHRGLTRRTQWLKRRERSELINDLVDAGQMKSVKVNRKTKPGVWYGTSYKKILAVTTAV